MKNWKCIVGATVLTPVCGVFVIGLMVGFMWLVKNAPIMHYMMLVVTGFAILVLFAIIWVGLFHHCKKWQKKKGKG